MANWSRALLNLGEGLGQIAQSVGQREIEAMRTLREENFMRLNAHYRQQADAAQFGQQKELMSMQEASLERTDTRRHGFDTTEAATRREHELQLTGRKESFDREMAGREEKLQRERYSREDLQSAERSYAAQTHSIDERLAEINDEMIKLHASAAESMGELDPALLQPWQEEIKQLHSQKRMLSQQRDIHLAQLGASGYEKLTAEEVAAIEGTQRSTPRSSRYAGKPRGEPAQRAAQSPIGEVPVAPTKPQGMLDREQLRIDRAQRPDAPLKPLTAREQLRTDRERGKVRSGQGAVGDLERRGARQTVRTGPNIIEKLFYAGRETTEAHADDAKAAQAWLKAEREGKQPSAEVAALVGAMSAQRKAALGITDAGARRAAPSLREDSAQIRATIRAAKDALARGEQLNRRQKERLQEVGIERLRSVYGWSDEQLAQIQPIASKRNRVAAR